MEEHGEVITIADQNVMTDVPFNDGKVKSKTVRRPIRKSLLFALRYGWWTGILILTFLFRHLIFTWPALAEFYSAKLRPLLIWPLTALTNFSPVSVSFFFLIAAAVTGCIVLSRLVLVFRLKKGSRLRRVGTSIRFTGIVLSTAFLLYMLFHGLNFARFPLSTQFGFEMRQHTNKELLDTARWLRDKAELARSGLNTDGNGAYEWPEGENTLSMLNQASSVFGDNELLGSRFGRQNVRAKAVPLSGLWSYTGTAGMFFPLLGEANVNTDMRPDEILAAALHEISHVKGVAREDEANFMAFYAGILHESPDYQYAGWLSAFIHASNQLARNDRELWAELWADMPEGIRIDISARNAYWKQFEGEVKTRATAVNNSFLVANGEADGVQSYGRMVDLVLAYYDQEVIDGNRLTP